MSEREVLARRLRVERAARGWGLKEAAEKIGIQRDTLSALEKGRRGVYSGTLERIAHAYNLSLAELLGEETTLAGKARAPATGQRPEDQPFMEDAREISLEEATEKVREIAEKDPPRRVYVVENVGRPPQRIHVLENAAGQLTYVFELVHTVGEAWQEGYEAGRRSVAAREEVER